MKHIPHATHIFSGIIAFAIIVPNVAFAAWRNPFSWGIFSQIFRHGEDTAQTVPITADYVSNIVASTTSSRSVNSAQTPSTVQAATTVTSVTPPTPTAPIQQPGGITCNNKYYPPCTDGGTRVCLDDGSNAYCRPPQSQAPTTQKSPETLAPQMTSQVPANATYCNGAYWNQCPSGQNLVCPQTGSAYCQSPVSATVVPSAPQPIEQTYMKKFFADAATTLDSIQNQANSAVSSHSGGSGDCSSANLGITAQICDYMYQAESPIYKLETWANSVQNPYRSASCDYKLYYPMEQILQDELSSFKSLIGGLGEFIGTASDAESRINQITTSTDSAINSLFQQAQLVASSCQ